MARRTTKRKTATKKKVAKKATKRKVAKKKTATRRKPAAKKKTATKRKTAAKRKPAAKKKAVRKKAAKKKTAKKATRKKVAKKATRKKATKKRVVKKKTAKKATKRKVAKKATRKKAVKRKVAKRKAPAKKKPLSAKLQPAEKRDSGADGKVKQRTKPLELYYWPTPNGWKISIMLEECGLPYKVKYVNIGLGDQFKSSFLKIAPNNRMPALVDPNGPGGKPISVFESGAILRYLGEKSGKFYPDDLRGRTEVDEWLFWQMANLGPNAGQANHFRNYMKGESRYAAERFTNEMNRLYGVMDKHLKNRDYLCSEYSIADIACWPWVLPYKGQGQDLARDFPNVYAWFKRVGGRKAVQTGLALGMEKHNQKLTKAQQERSRKILFGQKAR